MGADKSLCSDDADCAAPAVCQASSDASSRTCSTPLGDTARGSSLVELAEPVLAEKLVWNCFFLLALVSVFLLASRVNWKRVKKLVVPVACLLVGVTAGILNVFHNRALGHDQAYQILVAVYFHCMGLGVFVFLDKYEAYSRRATRNDARRATGGQKPHLDTGRSFLAAAAVVRKYRGAVGFSRTSRAGRAFKAFAVLINLVAPVVYLAGTYLDNSKVRRVGMAMGGINTFLLGIYTTWFLYPVLFDQQQLRQLMQGLNRPADDPVARRVASGIQRTKRLILAMLCASAIVCAQGLAVAFSDLMFVYSGVHMACTCLILVSLQVVMTASTAPKPSKSTQGTLAASSTVYAMSSDLLLRQASSAAKVRS